MRLTTKDKNGFYIDNDCIIPQSNDIIDKLGQLEDIEDELGIDLITLFKTLKQDYVYRKEKDIHIYNCEVCVRGINTRGLIVYDKGFGWGECDYTLDWEDYGKTWALTKEELEK